MRQRREQLSAYAILFAMVGAIYIVQCTTHPEFATYDNVARQSGSALARQASGAATCADLAAVKARADALVCQARGYGGYDYSGHGHDYGGYGYGGYDYGGYGYGGYDYGGYDYGGYDYGGYDYGGYDYGGYDYGGYDYGGYDYGGYDYGGYDYGGYDYGGYDYGGYGSMPLLGESLDAANRRLGCGFDLIAAPQCR